MIGVWFILGWYWSIFDSVDAFWTWVFYACGINESTLLCKNRPHWQAWTNKGEETNYFIFQKYITSETPKLSYFAPLAAIFFSSYSLSRLPSRPFHNGYIEILPTIAICKGCKKSQKLDAWGPKYDTFGVPDCTYQVTFCNSKKRSL